MIPSERSQEGSSLPSGEAESSVWEEQGRDWLENPLVIKLQGKQKEQTLAIPTNEKAYILEIEQLTFSDVGRAAVKISATGENLVTCSYPEDMEEHGLSISVVDQHIRIRSDEKKAFSVKEFNLKIDAPIQEIILSGGLPLEIDAAAMPLQRVHVRGATDCRLTNFEGENLSLLLEGAAALRAAGHCQNLKLELSGAGNLNCRDLIAETAVVQLNGAGHIVVSCEKNLDVGMAGLGLLEYYGSPEVSSSSVFKKFIRQVSPQLP